MVDRGGLGLSRRLFGAWGIGSAARLAAYDLDLAGAGPAGVSGILADGAGQLCQWLGVVWPAFRCGAVRIRHDALARAAAAAGDLGAVGRDGAAGAGPRDPPG